MVKIIERDLDIDLNRLADMEKINYIIVHHTGVALDQTVETIHNYHKNTLGWAGIGYHFYIRFNGDIYQGRPLPKSGAHTQGYNNRSIGVAVAGNFDNESLFSRKDQYNSLVELLKRLKKEYPGAPIKKHTDFATKSCPGTNFPWDQLLEAVEAVEEEQEIDGSDNIKVLKKDIVYVTGKEVTSYIIKDGDETITCIPVRKVENIGFNVDWTFERTEINLEYK